ncbi:MAG: single-stranded-DNA-specific exonuclease RecJ [Thermotogae bacterium]|nr:single-stranded-DNA-specific exonuclease RecJ [Thermotogota bacterium]
MPIRYIPHLPDPGEIEKLDGGIILKSRPFRQLLYNRRHKYDLDLRGLTLGKIMPSGNMGQLKEAVERLRWAIRKGRRIFLHGDYDADGITSVVLLYRVLKSQGAKVFPFVPDRFKDGYGLSKRGISEAKRWGAEIIVTLDCGISSYQEVELARNEGMEVIITDHHGLPDDLPNAIIVHPNLNSDLRMARESHLTGVGVAFKLAFSLLESLNGHGEDYKREMYKLLDLFAVGTVADVGKMLGDNRILVKHGLRLINEFRGAVKVGLRELIKSTDPITERDIGWYIAPHINAAGRMGKVSLALNLLLTDNGYTARRLVGELKKLNDERKRRQRELLSHILGSVDLSEPLLFVVREDIHEGIMGIVAGKLKDRFSRPVVVATVKNGRVKGSIRSLGNFNVKEILHKAAHRGIFTKDDSFGGHEHAGGFNVDASRLRDLKETLVAHARKVSAGGTEFEIPLTIDADLYPYEIDENFWEDYDTLRPYGPGFPEPVFLLKLDGPLSISHRYGESYTITYHRNSLTIKLTFEGPLPSPIPNEMVVGNLRIFRGEVIGEILLFPH